MLRIEAGMQAKSLTGHDRGRIYRIIRADEEYVWLVDGIHRTEENPKKKKRRHIQVIYQDVSADSRARREDKHV
ncbi:MAG: KOW domain-containing RNA-binding protein [Lachnospiraceae bacterium]|nr:KOW domain-containing RNA-binding protein [Lachnospiraceae bacterium]